MLALPVDPSLTLAPGKRARTSNKYAVELDGRPAGWLTDLSGATAAGELGSPAGRYEELALRCWPAMPRAFFDWILRSFAAQPAAGRQGRPLDMMGGLPRRGALPGVNQFPG